MSDQETLQEKPRVNVWRWLIGVVVVCLLMLLGLGVAYWFTDIANLKEEVRKLEDHLDATDPNWRAEEIVENREKVPDAENSARLIVGIVRSIPKGWPKQSFYEKVDDLPPPTERLSKEQVELLAANMKELAAVARNASQLADMPHGRHRLELSYSVFDTLLPDQQESRQVANLMKYHVLDLAEKGDFDAALRGCRAIINCGRSLGDEPFIISHLIRIACVAVGLNATERVLAQGQPSEKELAELQKLLMLEDSHPTHRIAMRGERAMTYDTISKLVEGRINQAHLRSLMTGEKQPWWAVWIGPSITRRDRLYTLRAMTKMVEVTKLPERDQHTEEKRIEADVKKLGSEATMTRQLVPAIVKIGEACRRKTAQVRAMLTLVAVERYRKEHDKWPEKLDDLKPKFLKEIPTDPYDGKPIRYVKVGDGVIVYTLGPDGKDDGGNVNRKTPMATGADLGYQLWDVKERRQEAKPKPVPMPEELPGGPGGLPGGPGQ